MAMRMRNRRIHRARRLRRGAVASATAAVVAPTAVATVPATAARATPPPLGVSYSVSGQTHIANLDQSLRLGPAKLVLALRNDGTFTASLPLPAVRFGFLLDLGSGGTLIPTVTTVHLTQLGAVTGRVGTDAAGNIVVTATAREHLSVDHAIINHIPYDLGDDCGVQTPLTLHLRNVGVFDLAKGGALRATFAIGDFSDCAGLDYAFSHLISGPGNTTTTVLTNGKIGIRPPTVERFTVTGRGRLAAENVTVPVGPAPLTLNLHRFGRAIGTLPLPPQRVAFTVPFQKTRESVAFTLAFRQVGALTAHLSTVDGHDRLVGGAFENLLPSKLVINGFATKLPATCRSDEPARVRVASRPGFSIRTGGMLAGTVDIGKFGHCGTYSVLFSKWLRAAGNTLALRLRPTS